MSERSTQAPGYGFGFVLIAVPSVAAAVLLVLAIPYSAGASARISGLYTNLAVPADQTLGADLDGYTLNMNSNLGSAEFWLSSEAKEEASFDSHLSQITFPPAADPHADLLVVADQKRVKLIRLQLRAKTLGMLRSFDVRDLAANVAVEKQVRIIRQDLALPPASGVLY